MPKDDLVYVGHMLDTARKASAKLNGKSRSEYDADEDLRIVLAHLIQTIGEAAGSRACGTKRIRTSHGSASSAFATESFMTIWMLTMTFCGKL